jgi:photosystem II stability/assembly factor-like uncharacterized protein
MRQYALFALLLIGSIAHAETIAEKLTRIDNEKTALKTAIEAKGQSVTTFETYSEAVASITGSANVPDVLPPGIKEISSISSPSWRIAYTGSFVSMLCVKYLGDGKVVSGGTVGIINSSSNYGETWALASDTLSYTIECIVNCGAGIVLAGAYLNSPETAHLYRSTNFGVSGSWSKISAFSGGKAVSIEYIGSSTVLAGLYDSGKIYRSQDKGMTWDEMLDTPRNAIRSIEYFGDGKAFLVAKDASTVNVLKTEDFGSSFDYIATFTASDSMALSYCGNGKLAIGLNPTGEIYYSSDYGINWNLATDTTETDISSMEYCENGIVYAGTGNNGWILKSINYGATWALDRDTEATKIRDITFCGNHRVLAAGTGDGPSTARIYSSFGGYDDTEKWK